jgi:hypothetical protein
MSSSRCSRRRSTCAPARRAPRRRAAAPVADARGPPPSKRTRGSSTSRSSPGCSRVTARGRRSACRSWRTRSGAHATPAAALHASALARWMGSARRPALGILSGGACQLRRRRAAAADRADLRAAADGVARHRRLQDQVRCAAIPYRRPPSPSEPQPIAQATNSRRYGASGAYGQPMVRAGAPPAGPPPPPPPRTKRPTWLLSATPAPNRCSLVAGRPAHGPHAAPPALLREPALCGHG